MRQFTLINFIILLIASSTFAVIAPLFGQAEALNLLQDKMYQPADMAGQNIAKTFVGGEPSVSRTSLQKTQSTSVLISSTATNGTNSVLRFQSSSGGNFVTPAWIYTIYSIGGTFLPM